MTTQLALLELPQQTRDPDLRVVLEWPPSVNRTWSQFAIPPALSAIRERVAMHRWDGFYQWLRKSTRVAGKKDKGAEDYRLKASWVLAACHVRFGESDIAVWLIIHPPTQRKPDLDNRGKQILDAMQLGQVIKNDNQVADYRATRGEPVAGGSVEVMVWSL